MWEKNVSKSMLLMQISECKFKNNLFGILVHCADPNIFKNHILNNYNDGIVCRCSRKTPCRGEIRFNYIFENKENGIYCFGKLTSIMICHNFNITINGQAGVKIADQAFASIVSNLIGNNGAQVLR